MYCAQLGANIGALIDYTNRRHSQHIATYRLQGCGRSDAARFIGAPCIQFSIIYEYICAMIALPVAFHAAYLHKPSQNCHVGA